MSDLHDHWERVYMTKSEKAVSWYQPVFTKSLNLIRAAVSDTASSVIDIGGGASTLIDSLLDVGYDDLTVMDVSEAALNQAKIRLAERARFVTWIAADITNWLPPRTWDVWHDRAVFHFLNEPTAQASYITALEAGTRAGSIAVISTFALDGPDRCSGLPVQRYSATSLAQRIGPLFELVTEDVEHHVTPGGAAQSFIYAVLKRS